MKVYLPSNVRPLLGDISKYRYIILYGGRGSSKSHTIAIVLLIFAATKKLRILCVREFMGTMKESCHKLLCDYIDKLGLTNFYDTTNNRIVGQNGSEFIFMGIRQNPQSVKSLEGVHICWGEEAQTMSSESLEMLIPTIRVEGSQLWFSMNPDDESDPVYQLILNPPPNTLLININYTDNPFCPQTLIDEAEYMKDIDYERYQHVWMGEPLKLSDAVIFRNKFEVRNFEVPASAQFRQGVDFGYTDALAATQSYIEGEYLYICGEAGGTNIDTESMPQKLIDGIPDFKKWKVYGDSADPKAIIYLRNRGFRVEKVKKGPNSVLDGINYLKSFRRIFIHPSCVNTINEFNNYKWETDRMTGEIIAKPEDKNNHWIDSLRYAYENIALNNGLTLDQWKTFNGASQRI